MVNDPAFTSEPFSVFTRWIETEFTAELEPQDLVPADEADAERQRLTVEVGGKRLEVTLPATLGFPAALNAAPAGGTSRPAGVLAGAGPRPAATRSSPPCRGLS